MKNIGMGKKRKSVATSLDEVDRTMYATFSTAANSLSQLYTHSMNHQKLSFQAGQRHALDKLYQWILRQQQEAGARVTTIDILTYLQNELDYCGDEPSMSPRAPVSHQHLQGPAHFANTGFLVSGPSAQISASQGPPRSEHYENQPKNSVFSNALSSPVRRTLQHYHLAQGGGGGYCSSGAPPPPQGNNATNQNRDSNLNDSLMDMHQDSPGPESNY